MNKMPPIGSTIDQRYQLRRELAVGGVATIYEAQHLYTQRRVAIKILHKADATNKARLLREAAALQGERHRALIDVLDAGETTDIGPYIVMELLKGRSLETMLAARQRLDFQEVVRIGAELCDALAFVHAHGLVHRDIKPGNVFLLGENPIEVKLIDFGIVATPFGDKLTKESQVPGTPEYMAPEHIRQEPLDRRSDVYSLGVTLFECLTGSVPFSGTYSELVVQFSQPGQAPKVTDSRPDVPAPLARAVERALARRAPERFNNMAEFSAALRQLENLPSRRETPTVPQRRAFRRAPYTTPIRLVLPDGTCIDGRSEDISEGGLLLLIERPSSAGESINVRFASPISGVIVTVTALVRWVRPARGGKAVLGCSFTELQQELRQEIANYVEWIGDPTVVPE